jgi:thiamine-monophosphate kinase
MTKARHQHERLHGEADIVAVLAPLAAGAPGAFGLQDDCALLTPEPRTELVLKTDPVAEGVHFLPDDTPQDIAWKALAVNVSDLAAKGARPLGYLMALSFPEAPTRAWLTAFAAGLAEAQTRFGCHLLGGDTDRRPGPLTVSITAIGSVPQGQMVRRGTARAGDALLVSGSIGDAGLGLALARDPDLATAWGPSKDEAGFLMHRYRRPEPRLALAPVLRQYASAAMDISDGLVKDLERMLRASGLGGRIAAADVPLSPAARRFVGQAPDQSDRRLAHLITAGDDYEVLAAVTGPPERCAELQAAAAQVGVPLTKVGVVGHSGWPEHGSGLRIDGPDGQPLAVSRTGWDHF